MSHAPRRALPRAMPRSPCAALRVSYVTTHPCSRLEMTDHLFEVTLSYVAVNVRFNLQLKRNPCGSHLDKLPKDTHIII